MPSEASLIGHRYCGACNVSPVLPRRPATLFANSFTDHRPTVSVIIPTFNRQTIGRALSSVLRQSRKDLEVIIVDDASTDNSLDQVCRSDDRRIKIIAHRVNRGAAAARNTGIRAARGNYIAFLDSDDLWAPNKLERQLD